MRRRPCKKGVRTINGDVTEELVNVTYVDISARKSLLKIRNKHKFKNKVNIGNFTSAKYAMQYNLEIFQKYKKHR